MIPSKPNQLAAFFSEDVLLLGKVQVVVGNLFFEFFYATNYAVGVTSIMSTEQSVLDRVVCKATVLLRRMNHSWQPVNACIVSEESLFNLFSDHLAQLSVWQNECVVDLRSARRYAWNSWLEWRLALLRFPSVHGNYVQRCLHGPAVGVLQVADARA